MKKIIPAVVVLVFVSCIGISAFAQKAASQNFGEKRFKELCSICHPDGGNIVNPKKTLHKADREANNVKTAADVVNRMRNPGPGMTKFDEKTVPDKEAQEIAKYVIRAFK
ncbi:MAG TPA: c-type cytochrome [Nitrospirota bacterium]